MKRSRVMHLVVVLPLMLCRSGFGQVASPTKPSGKPTPTHSEMYISPADRPNSLKDLLKLAPLVVVGTVDASNFPARLPNPKSSSYIESDVVVLVTEVIKGNALDNQRTLKRIIVSQIGGRYEGQTVVPTGEGLLEQGQHVILFLQPETRKQLPGIAGLPRFLIVGEYSGKFRVNGSRVEASPNVRSGLRLDKAETVATFRQKVAAELAKQP